MQNLMFLYLESPQIEKNYYEKAFDIWVNAKNGQGFHAMLKESEKS